MNDTDTLLFAFVLIATIAFLLLSFVCYELSMIRKEIFRCGQDIDVADKFIRKNKE